MKIVVVVRTLNEERNIARFCECYSWADEIIISDGGSSDDTVSIADKFYNTYFYEFPDKVWYTDKIFANPRGKHINFLIDRALYHKADVIIFDDCDSVPTKELQTWGRNIIEGCQQDMIFAYRLFVLGQDRYFPDMNNPGQSLWAWKSSVDICADEESNTISMKIPDVPTLKLLHPYSLLHYFYPDEETLQKKKEAYILTGEVSENYNPINQFGRIEKLPDWAVWK